MNDRVLLVTGASSDVGAALIERVAANYAKIVCHYRNSLTVIEGLQSKLGDKIVPVGADFESEESTENFIGEVLNRKLAPAHFVHLSSGNGGVNVKFAKTGWTRFEAEINTAFRSAVMCCQAFAPLMAKAGHGKIVFMLTAQVLREPTKPYSSAYTSIKHALFGLMKSLSAEYIAKGITVNGVSPAEIDTKFLNFPDIVKRISIEKSPIKRLLTVDDVAPAFEFLLSPGADTITGQNIAVTAGN